MSRAVQIPWNTASTREEVMFSLGNESVPPQRTPQVRAGPIEDVGKYVASNQKCLPQVHVWGTWTSIGDGVWGASGTWDVAFESSPTSCSEVPVSCLLHREQAAAPRSCHYERSSSRARPSCHKGTGTGHLNCEPFQIRHLGKETN